MALLFVVFFILLPVYSLYPIFGKDTLLVYVLFWVGLIVFGFVKGIIQGVCKNKSQKQTQPSFNFYNHRVVKTKKQSKCEDNFNEDYFDYEWETNCEYCGELLEDCECDHHEESEYDIGL